MNNRIVTSRLAEINKNSILKISNRNGQVVDLGLGEREYKYSPIQELSVSSMPIRNSYEASAYGVSLLNGLKIFVAMKDISLFNEFTRIWINTQPNSQLDNPEYFVTSNQPALSQSMIIIDKVDGN